MTSPERLSPHIVTDSTCDLPEGYKKEHGIDVVPAVVMFDGQSFLDGVNITVGKLIEVMATSPDLPTTGAPGSEIFVQKYKDTEGAILSIHVTDKLSGFVQRAQEAKRTVDPVGERITVFDSESTSMGLGFFIMEAVRLRGEGKSMPEIREALENVKKRSVFFISLDTLRNVRQGGRISKGTEVLGSLLDIKPILEVRDGRVEILEKPRRRKQSLSRMVELVREHCPLERVAVVHAAAEEEARQVAEEIQQFFSGDILLVETGPALAVQAGPGTIGIAAVQAKG